VINILIISEDYPLPGQISKGPFIVSQAVALKKHVNVTAMGLIALPLINKKKQGAITGPNKAEVKGVISYYPRYIDFPRFSEYLNAISMICSVMYCILKNKIKVDIIHAHYTYYAGYVACFVGKILGNFPTLAKWKGGHNILGKFIRILKPESDEIYVLTAFYPQSGG